MYNDEDTFNFQQERVQFDLDPNSKAAPTALNKKPDSKIAIVMTFHDPIPLGKSGLAEGILVADQNGKVKAWVV
jgi:hypothetical protein